MFQYQYIVPAVTPAWISSRIWLPNTISKSATSRRWTKHLFSSKTSLRTRTH